ncbi:HTH DNA binding protein [Mycobacterium phage Sparky]|uniref:HTH DNA binding protein n=1 Tax=Mycobacterium phage Sparky TaxID=1527493 RepID=A0A076G994_9CAUD|nr:HTH DNA binding protein [Mycobacterium phage Sparky]AII28193.1 HTH DNA binding protein [Mycobacterium phage Sparky]
MLIVLIIAAVAIIDDPIYSVEDAAEILCVSPSFLRDKLRKRQFAGYKAAGRWMLRESQIRAAMDAMSTEARQPEPASPAALPARSRIRRRVHSQAAAC